MTPYEAMQQKLAARVAQNTGTSVGQSDLGGPQGGGGFVQSGTGGVNLATGSALGGGSGVPSFGTFSSGPLLNGMPWDQGMAQMNAQSAAGNSGGLSGSDAFFASANAPMRTGYVTSMKSNGGGTNAIPFGRAGASTSVLQSLINTMNSGQQQQQQANQQQYDALMSTVKGGMGKVDKYLGQLGKAGETRIAQNEAKNTGAMQQSLVSRGLGNTTIQDSALRGVKTDAENERQALGESLAQQKVGTTLDMTKMYGDALLSRVNQGPNLGMYLNLIQTLAAR